MELAVRSGGHSVAGHSVSDGGIVLDLSDMRALQIDAERRTAWAETGLTAGEYTAAAGAYGLATGFGDTGSVGIGGITLGGGVGYLVRKYGLTIDNLLAAEIVTADGRLLRRTPRRIRTSSGRSAAAAATSAWRPGSSSGCTRSIRSWAGCWSCRRRPTSSPRSWPRRRPRRRSCRPSPTSCPRRPCRSCPPSITASWSCWPCWSTPAQVEAGEQRHRAVPGARHADRRYGPADALPGDLPAGGWRLPPDSGGSHDVRRHDRPRRRPRRSSSISRLPTRPMRVAQLRVLGGAMARVPVEATAFAHRQSRIMVNLAAFYKGPEDRAVRQAWVADFAAAIYQGDCRRLRQLPGRRGRGAGPRRPTRGRPGTGWWRSRLATIRPTFSGSTRISRRSSKVQGSFEREKTEAARGTPRPPAWQ